MGEEEQGVDPFHRHSDKGRDGLTMTMLNEEEEENNISLNYSG